MRARNSRGSSAAAARAVIVTGHLPPLPLGYDGGELGIHFGFEYTGS